MKTLKQRFINLHDKVPEQYRHSIIFSIETEQDSSLYTLNVIYQEVIHDTKLAQYILNRLKDMKII